MTFLPVIVSCEYRWRTRARTAADLARHGIEPLLIRTRCAPAFPRILRLAAVTAMRAALEAGLDLLWLEDDVKTDDRLPAALWMAAEQRDHPTVLCVLPDECQPAHVLDALRSGRPMDLHVSGLPNVSMWWGSQAVYVPRDAMPFLLSSPHMLQPGNWLAFDTAIRNAYGEAGLPLYGVFPNPVQHLNEPSARKVTSNEAPRRTRLSPTFGWWGV